MELLVMLTTQWVIIQELLSVIKFGFANDIGDWAGQGSTYHDISNVHFCFEQFEKEVHTFYEYITIMTFFRKRTNSFHLKMYKIDSFLV